MTNVKLTQDLIDLNMSFVNKDEAIRFCGEKLFKAGCIESGYIDKMIERDKMVSVYIGNNIAIPHGTDEARSLVKKSGICLCQVPKGVAFGEETANILFGIAGIGDEHLEILQKIAIFCSDINNVKKLIAAKSKFEIINLISF
ncbi:MAG: PTS sugar transporter subunit IIA [Bifidobacteriaceae bacterium]|jgi:PTS system mannitol-specific IIA component|nr:PTS sugar transporter subunit IIA [Bifidobacteriaceae bacterium]